MVWFAFLAYMSGVLVVLSRQINGRLALSTSAMQASFWNHIVGFVFITIIAFAWGGLFSGDPWGAPWWAYLGGPLGVIFIAAGSWLIVRIGAAQTAMLVIAGQMMSSVALDIALGAPGSPIARIAGVSLIFAGMAVSRMHRKPATSA